MHHHLSDLSIDRLRMQLDDTDDLREQVILLDTLSGLLLRVDPSRGVACAGEALETARSLKDNYWIARSYIRLSDGAVLRTEFDLARNYLKRAWNLVKSSVDDRYLGVKARIGRDLGNLHARLGESEQALRLIGMSLKYGRQLGDPREIGASLQALGELYAHLGFSRKALEALREGLELFEENDIPEGIPSTLFALGNLYAAADDRENALKCFDECREQYRRAGERRREAHALQRLGTIYLKAGDSDRAFRYLEKGAEQYRELQDYLHYALAVVDIGHLYVERNDLQSARSRFGEVLAELEDLHHEAGVAVIRTGYAGVLAREERWEEIPGLLKPALNALRQSGLHPRQLAACGLLAEACEKTGCLPEALAYYREFITLEEQRGRDVLQQIMARFDLERRLRKIESELAMSSEEMKERQQRMEEQMREVTAESLRLTEYHGMLKRLHERLKTLRENGEEEMSLVRDLIRQLSLRSVRVEAWKMFERQLRRLDERFPE